ncbi:hypothetical protein OBBRIDRAFT_740716 [Obba rivulosa]|uniref:Mitochondrial import inner membrane translocase subunit TIM50 n=1 Tax=Obba rivulosa TaxID=1052685 RepID=A0A8E2DFL5_9APHY|nr:hypothetical protein OBBRIDRAFT_740716 [Obba rivulosa]
MPNTRRRRPHHPTSRWRDIHAPIASSQPFSSHPISGAEFARSSYGRPGVHEPPRSLFPAQETSYGGNYEVRRHPDFASYHVSHPQVYHDTDSASSSRPRSPPREPRAYREADRSVTPPPPRPPSPTYLALAQDQPSRLSDPTDSRKLLILDLNGTLVFRSQGGHRPRPRYPYEDGAQQDGPPVPRLRPVHPRPYMPAFRQYLFAAETKAWLDVMIWSSAQPHSVADMVDKSFGGDKDGLLAIWARDTLGLSQDHYPSTPRSSRSPSPTAARSPARVHSALTTLLLDDSPRKAELQPYNHVCIGEYSAALRAKDLESFQKGSEWDAAQAARRELEASLENGASGSTDAPDTAAEDSEAPLSPLLDALDAPPPGEYDETLLCVVGVLEEVKHQRNVAAWIRAGGLWGPDRAPAEESPAPLMWFEHAPTVEYWAKKGREALTRLGIPVEHGIER